MRVDIGERIGGGPAIRTWLVVEIFEFQVAFLFLCTTQYTCYVAKFLRARATRPTVLYLQTSSPVQRNSYATHEYIENFDG